MALLSITAGCKKNEDIKTAVNQADISKLPLVTAAATTGYLGVTCGYQYSDQLTGPLTYPGQQNISLYNPDPKNPNNTWDDWISQLIQAGVDFVCPNLTGANADFDDTPANIAPMIAAINKRGLQNQLKVAAFDDNAASWCAMWNYANGRGHGYDKPFDISKPANWKFIYEQNYKIFFKTVPDANRFKINGRPVIIIWTGSDFFIANMQGNASKAITYVRQKCQADFGFNPYIILSQDFFTNDTTCLAAGIADAKEDWFGAPNTSFSLDKFRSASVGVVASQFAHPGEDVYIDPKHGNTLETGLNQTVGAGAQLTLCEGFTDYEEDAALFRVRNIDDNGKTLTYAQTGYDYPNQRLGILRKHSRNPFPTTLRLEAEGCDYFGGAAGGKGKKNFYRNGNIAINPTTDPEGGAFEVSSVQKNEWLEWRRLPFNNHMSIQVRLANPLSNMQAHLIIDGVDKPAKKLPNTGAANKWTLFDFGDLGAFSKSYHNVRIVFNTGGVQVNWIMLTSHS